MEEWVGGAINKIKTKHMYGTLATGVKKNCRKSMPTLPDHDDDDDDDEDVVAA